MQKINLTGTWQGFGTDEFQKETLSFTGEVPGCVHTDLLKENIIKDIFWRDNTDSIQWIERWNWVYKKEFTLDTINENANLVFEGLDVYCDIYVNEHYVGFADDMFIPYSFPVDGLLKEGTNTVKVLFRSPILTTLGKQKRNAAFTYERLHTRRMQCTYGWDWVARFVTCGIWKPAYLTFGNEMSAESVYVYTKSIDAESAQIVLDVSMQHQESGGFVTTELYSPNGNLIYSNRRYCKESSFTETVDIVNPELWYPQGFGNQPLYQAVISVGAEKTVETFGIRTVKILQIQDEADSASAQMCRNLQQTESGKEYDQNETFSGFILLVNGIRIFCKGANWVPSEPFPSAETDVKITHLLSLAKEANVNMIRIWGGGIFERQHFYAECDRLGLLVTQDFLMACGAYPEEEPSFVAHLQQEAEYAAKSLRNHPCLMWWTGDNENAINGSEEEPIYNGRTSALYGIAPMLKKYDPQRTFLPSSPYGGKKYASKTRGTTHNTQFLGSIFNYFEQENLSDYKDYYKHYLARFVAEEPTMGAVCLSSLKKMMKEEDIFGDTDAMWKYHMQTNPGLPHHLFDYNVMFAEKILGKFEDTHDRYFKLKYIQYEWIRITLEQYRRNKWFCSGVLYWMLSDCWPAASGWTFLDYYGLPKASFYSFKRSASGLIVSLDKPDTTKNEYTATVCNDTLTEYEAEVTIFVLDTKTGIQSGETTKTHTIPKNTSVLIEKVEFEPLNETSIVLCALKTEHIYDRAFYRNGNLPIIKTGAVKVVEKDDTTITVHADSYVHVVELESDCIFDDNYFSLLPNETRKIGYRKFADGASEKITVLGYTL